MRGAAISILAFVCLLTPAWASAASKSAPAPDRPKLEPASVLSLQMRALNAQKGREVAVIQGQNRFTRWLDEGHEKLFCWMDNAVRAVDTRGLADNAPYDPELSTFKLKVLTRAGGEKQRKKHRLQSPVPGGFGFAAAGEEPPPVSGQRRPGLLAGHGSDETGVGHAPRNAGHVPHAG